MLAGIFCTHMGEMAMSNIYRTSQIAAIIGVHPNTIRLYENLSGGERQRLFIVLALIPNPKMVFLDELTTGLDARARRQMWQILEELKKTGITILLTSHFMDEVEALCDEICILRKGRIRYIGTVAGAREATGCTDFEEAYLALSPEAGR